MDVVNFSATSALFPMNQFAVAGKMGNCNFDTFNKRETLSVLNPRVVSFSRFEKRVSIEESTSNPFSAFFPFIPHLLSLCQHIIMILKTVMRLEHSVCSWKLCKNLPPIRSEAVRWIGLIIFKSTLRSRVDDVLLRGKAMRLEHIYSIECFLLPSIRYAFVTIC